MSSVRGRLSAYGWRRIAVSVVVVVFLAVFVAMLRQLVAYPIVGWFPDALGLFGDQNVTAHRIHDFGLSLLFWTAAIGLLAQLRNPRRNVAGQLMAIVPWAGLLIAFALTSHWAPAPIVAVFGGLSVLAAIVHPSGRGLVEAVSVSGVNRVLLALVIVAAVPLLAFAVTQIGLQTGTIEPAHDHGEAGHDHQEVHQEHVESGHFALMMALSIAIIGVGLVASLRPPGWRLAAWVTGGLPVVIGIASLVYPEAASSADLIWGIAAVFWGVLFITTAQYTEDSDLRTTFRARGLEGTGEP